MPHRQTPCTRKQLSTKAEQEFGASISHLPRPSVAMTLSKVCSPLSSLPAGLSSNYPSGKWPYNAPLSGFLTCSHSPKCFLGSPPKNMTSPQILVSGPESSQGSSAGTRQNDRKQINQEFQDVNPDVVSSSQLLFSICKRIFP